MLLLVTAELSNGC